MAETTREVVNDMKSLGKQAIDTGKGAMHEAKSELRSQWGDTYDTIKGKAQDAFSASEDFVKEHPITTVLGACAVGFVAGLIARRSRH
ncbi:MAG TPA: hypothetical protein VF412_03630 [Bdellovibrio sp.]|uniref:DUF883 family protein n=1 Tax=Bdellovibrio sp. TaxID=28201 RepID=UPI002F0CDF85